METIPFKRHRAGVSKKMTSSKKSSARTMQLRGINKPSSNSWPWVIVIIVVVVALAGILILRFSRASEQGSAPLTADQLKSYIQTQLATQNKSSVSTPITVNKYAEFQFGNKFSPAPAYVSYYIDDVPVARATSSPFSFVWDSSRVSNGTHTLSAVAFDKNDQPLGATQRTVEVNNSGGAIEDAKNVITYPWYWLLQL